MGASEYIPGMDIAWEELSPAEKAGYVTGEGLAMLAPFGLIGKGLKFGSSFLIGGTRSALESGIKTHYLDNLHISHDPWAVYSMKGTSTNPKPDEFGKSKKELGEGGFG